MTEKSVIPKCQENQWLLAVRAFGAEETSTKFLGGFEFVQAAVVHFDGPSVACFSDGDYNALGSREEMPSPARHLLTVSEGFAPLRQLWLSVCSDIKEPPEDL